MRNSNVNINLGAGGAMVETGHNADSRPSSTESCKSNPSANDPMNYKDMLVQFAKLSQQGNIGFFFGFLNRLNFFLSKRQFAIIRRLIITNLQSRFNIVFR